MSALAIGALAAPAMAAVPNASANYSFTTLNNANDLTFNQLLGINNSGLIAGYFGSGAALHPNKGYTLAPPYGQSNYTNENFPGSKQTQVTGLNNIGVTVGFWSNRNEPSMVNPNFGFYERNGEFHSVNFPTHDPSDPPVDQLLGVNDSDIAVGFYTDHNGVNHGYEFNIGTGAFSRVNVSGDTNVTAAGINNLGDVTGFATNGAGNTEAYLLERNGTLFHLNFPGAKSTQAFGVNNGDEVVGQYVVGAATHGFVWFPAVGFVTVNDPNGGDTTTINGVNDHGQLVGFYVDSAGNTDGLLATPRP